MTKMKSKKMNKSTFAIVIMAIVMVAILAFGGTYAYFTANAVGESVSNIKTAQLILRNLGTDGNEARLKYDDAKQVVPGDYVFGSGVLNPDSEDDIYEWQRIHLDLGRNGNDSVQGTNAASYVFVTINVFANTGIEDSTPLMVKYGAGDDDFAPVLRLIPRLGIPNKTTGARTWDGSNWVNDTSDDYGGENWVQFDKDDDDDVNNATYIFYFKLDDTKQDRDRFEQIDFQFALQFDPRVMADRAQVEKENIPDRGGSYPSRAEQIAALETAGYIQAMDYSTGTGVEILNIYEKTNVYKTTNETGDVLDMAAGIQSIMGVNVGFKMELQMIQQTGFNTPGDAYRAVRLGFNGSYTDDDLKPGWDTENGGTSDTGDDDTVH